MKRWEIEKEKGEREERKEREKRRRACANTCVRVSEEKKCVCLRACMQTREKALLPRGTLIVGSQSIAQERSSAREQRQFLPPRSRETAVNFMFDTARPSGCVLRQATFLECTLQPPSAGP